MTTKMIRLLTAIMLSVVLAVGISGQDLGFSSDSTTVGGSGQDFSAQVTYHQSSTYEIAIPATIPANTTTAYIKMNQLDLCTGEAIAVSVSGIDADGTLHLRDTKKKREMGVVIYKSGGTRLANGDVIYTFRNDAEAGQEIKDASIYISANEVPGPGNYTGSLTFNVQILQ